MGFFNKKKEMTEMDIELESDRVNYELKKQGKISDLNARKAKLKAMKSGNDTSTKKKVTKKLAKFGSALLKDAKSEYKKSKKKRAQTFGGGFKL